MKGSRNCAVNKTECGACARSSVAASFLTTASRQSFCSCRNVSSGEPWAVNSTSPGRRVGRRPLRRKGRGKKPRARQEEAQSSFLLLCVADSRVLPSGLATCLEAAKVLLASIPCSARPPPLSRNPLPARPLIDARVIEVHVVKRRVGFVGGQIKRHRSRPHKQARI